jgi:hypothetical protein
MKTKIYLLLAIVSIVLLTSCSKPSTKRWGYTITSAEVIPWSKTGKVNGCEFIINDSIKIICSEYGPNDFNYILYLNDTIYSYQRFWGQMTQDVDIQKYSQYYIGSCFPSHISPIEDRKVSYKNIVDKMQKEYIESIVEQTEYLKYYNISLNIEQEYENIKCFQN